MQPFRVSDVNKMSEILNVFSGLDDIRWNEATNYNMINYCRNDLTAEEKLLTHWLCYITDRQMPFQRVWNVGGYVISQIVRVYSANPGWRVWEEVLEPFVDMTGSHMFIKSSHDKVNPRLERYGISGNDVHFASRYMPEDLILIYRTLAILDRVADRRIARFICMALDEESGIENEIKIMAVALNQLTYLAGGAVSGVTFNHRRDEMRQQATDFELNTDTNVSLYGRKRLWCSIRDYLKSPEFNDIFINALRDNECSCSDRWKRESMQLKAALKVMELPGDVWNNAEIFRDGLFRPYISNERESWDMPRTVREIHNLIQAQLTRFYPEQLDVTFDFVPRMCQRSMCSVCFFGAGIRKVCHEKKGLLCPIALYSCGYTHHCDPSSCDFKKDSVRGHCKSSLAGNCA